MSVNNLNPEKVLISVSTNTNTLNAIKGKTYQLAIHKDGQFKKLPFSFKDSETTSFIIPKRELFSDINIVTIFDEKDTPLLERLIYNNKKTNTSNINFAISKIKTENDSAYFSIYAVNNKTAGKELNNL